MLFTSNTDMRNLDDEEEDEEEDAEDASIDDALLGELDDDTVVDEEVDPLVKSELGVPLEEEEEKEAEPKFLEDEEEDEEDMDYDSFDDRDEL